MQRFDSYLLGCLATGATALAAEDPSLVSKRQYHLFNPTPNALLRPMSTDRPDKTETPTTIDPGHFQIEMDLVNYTYDKEHPGGAKVRSESWGIAPANLKVGVLHNVDLHLMLPGYTSSRTHDFGARVVERSRGFGDVVVRSKVNLWGNDGGRTALGIMPYVKLPTNEDGLGNNSVEGGVIMPLGVELPMGWDMGVMTELDIARDRFEGGYHPEFVHTLTFGHDIVGKLGGYVEFFSLVSTERGSNWVGTLDLGFTYALTENIQLDGGVNIGVTRDADDVNPFVGLSVRF